MKRLTVGLLFLTLAGCGGGGGSSSTSSSSSESYPIHFRGSIFKTLYIYAEYGNYGWGSISINGDVDVIMYENGSMSIDHAVSWECKSSSTGEVYNCVPKSKSITYGGTYADGKFTLWQSDCDDEGVSCITGTYSENFISGEGYGSDVWKCTEYGNCRLFVETSMTLARQ